MQKSIQFAELKWEYLSKIAPANPELLLYFKISIGVIMSSNIRNCKRHHHTAII